MKKEGPFAPVELKRTTQFDTSDPGLRIEFLLVKQEKYPCQSVHAGSHCAAKYLWNT